MNTNKTSHTSNNEFIAYTASFREKFAPAKKVLFVQAPQLLFESINLEVVRNRGCYAYPPTGLQWLATALAKRSLEIEICDLNLLLLQKIISDPSYDCDNWLSLLDEVLEEFQPTIVGVTCLSVYTDLFNPTHPLTAILRNLMDAKRYLVMAGGPTVSNEINRYLEQDLCHFVVRGEGEYRINYLFDALFENQIRHTATDGIYFKHNETVCQTHGDNQPVTIRGNLIKSFSHIAVEDYCTAGCLNPYSRMAGQDTIYSVFQLNRGCRGNCSFCGVRPFMGKGIRSHDVGSALEEVRYLVEERGVRHFDVLDDDFLAVPPVTISFLEGLSDLRKSGYDISWSANNGFITHSITRELLDLMRNSGCNGFKIGVESGNPVMLKRIHKPGTPATFRKIAAMLQDYPEFFVGGNYIIGFFGEETFAQMAETYRLAVELNLDWSSFSIFQVTNNSDSSGYNKHPGGSGATDFIPTKSIANRDLREDQSLPLGPDVFTLPGDLVPSRELLKNIWLTFNLVGNYIDNKHLRAGGDATTFVCWINALRVSYPENPYMALFAGLGNVTLGNIRGAEVDLARCSAILADSVSWRYRFEAFGLSRLIQNFPSSREQVHKALGDLLAMYK